MTRFAWMFLILVIVVVESSGDIKSYDFNLIDDVPSKVILDFDKQNLIVEQGKKKQLLAHFTQIEEEDQEDERKLNDFTEFLPEIHNVIFVDYNFDGYIDIGVLMYTGYSGNNAYRDYYFYNPITKTYSLQIKQACNLEIYSKEDRVLIGWEKSGLSAYRNVYIINKYGDAFLALCGVGRWSKNEEEGMVYTYDSNVKVNVDRAYYYDEPEGKKSKIYVVKGDHVDVLDLLEEKEKIWIKVAYKAKRKTYKGWVKFTDLAFEKLK